MDDIDRFLKEDLDEKGDITTNSLFKKEKAVAKIIAKEDAIIAGLFEAKKVFERTGGRLNPYFEDGDEIKKNQVVAEVKGTARSILSGERLALNFICRMSGIASETKYLTDKCKKINSKVVVAATRKTTPGFRKYEKKAVEIAGGDPHRYGLYDAVLIKDNHLKLTDSLSNSIKIVKEKIKNKIIEIEVENEKDALEAAKTNVDYIMLDNFSPEKGEKIAQQIKSIDPNIKIEISGGITPNNIIKYALFADRISLGHLTHSIKSKDFSLEII